MEFRRQADGDRLSRRKSAAVTGAVASFSSGNFATGWVAMMPAALYWTRGAAVALLSRRAPLQRAALNAVASHDNGSDHLAAGTYIQTCVRANITLDGKNIKLQQCGGGAGSGR